MDTIKGLIHTQSFWVFIAVALIGGLGTIFPIPLLGVIIAALTIFGVSLQGVETVRAQKELDRKYTSVLKEIEHAREEAAKQHTEAMQETAQAKKNAEMQHTEALQEIDQARKEAAIQYAEAAEKIKKVRDEARAENILLNANKFATSLMEKDKLVNEAVALYPDFRQREYRELGLEMSAAVIGNVDYIKEMYLKAAGYPFDAPYSESRLDEEERAIFIDHAITYLSETVQQTANTDAQGLLYLACMYGSRHQYDEMMMVLDKTSQISLIAQVMKDQFRERPMMLILLGACGVDQTRIERLRKTLNLPETTEHFFCNYITEIYPLNPNYQHGEFIKWVAVKRPDAPGISGTSVISISPLYPALEGTVYASSSTPNGRPEEIVPAQQDKRVSIEELYRILTSLFILFCAIG
jgi:hypothetical protein